MAAGKGKVTLDMSGTTKTCMLHDVLNSLPISLVWPRLLKED